MEFMGLNAVCLEEVTLLSSLTFFSVYTLFFEDVFSAFKMIEQKIRSLKTETYI